MLTDPMGLVAPLFCLVVGITDGDTLTARCGPPGAYQTLKVRLAEIDAPEKHQAFGERSRQHLAALCFQKPAELRVTTRDRYGRSVARVAYDGVDANAAMVRDGMAWAYIRYLKDAGFKDLQERARARKAGLWLDKDPQAPWEWRAARRKGSKAEEREASTAGLPG